jgi:DNA polymerase-1
VFVNFQAIPDVVRRALVPKLEAFSFFDYVQVEPRLFAYFVSRLGDDTIASWYRQGRDVYREIAARVLAQPVDQVTDGERQQGKVWFLMSLYGAGPKAIAAKTGMPLEEAKGFYREFHERMPQIRLLSNPRPRSERALRFWQPGAIERQLANRGYLTTPWGRRLHPEAGGEYKMLNKLVQATAADLMKLAVIHVHRWARSNGLQSRIVLIVHDELMLDGTVAELPLLHEAVPGLMSRPDQVAAEINAVVPITVDHDVSDSNWAEKISYTDWLASYRGRAA